MRQGCSTHDVSVLVSNFSCQLGPIQQPAQGIRSSWLHQLGLGQLHSSYFPLRITRPVLGRHRHWENCPSWENSGKYRAPLIIHLLWTSCWSVYSDWHGGLLLPPRRPLSLLAWQQMSFNNLQSQRWSVPRHRTMRLWWGPTWLQYDQWACLQGEGWWR